MSEKHIFEIDCSDEHPTINDDHMPGNTDDGKINRWRGDFSSRWVEALDMNSNKTIHYGVNKRAVEFHYLRRVNWMKGRFI